ALAISLFRFKVSASFLRTTPDKKPAPNARRCALPSAALWMPCSLAVRPRLRLDMPKPPLNRAGAKSRRRHLNRRGGRRALAGREEPPHTLSLRGKSRSKVSNGVAAFAARGSSLDWQKSPQFARCLSDADR